IPGRNSMPPPELAADTPVLKVTHPGEVHVLVLFRHELDLATLNDAHGLLSHRRGLDVPLVGEPGLDDDARAVTLGNLVDVLFYRFKQTQLLHLEDNGSASLEAVETYQRWWHIQIGVGQRLTGDVESLGAGQYPGM